MITQLFVTDESHRHLWGTSYTPPALILLNISEGRRSAVVLGTLPDSPVKVGCRICELDGEEIVSIYQLIGILQRHKPGDKVDILTQFLDEKAIQSTITLVDQRRLVRLMFDCMPFAGRNNDSFVSKKII